jgi:hypothetical protein
MSKKSHNILQAVLVFFALAFAITCLMGGFVAKYYSGESDATATLLAETIEETTLTALEPGLVFLPQPEPEPQSEPVLERDPASLVIIEEFWEFAVDFYGELTMWSEPEESYPGLIVMKMLGEGGEYLGYSEQYYVPAEVWYAADIGIGNSFSEERIGDSHVVCGDVIKVMARNSKHSGGFFNLPGLAESIERINREDIPGWGM